MRLLIEQYFTGVGQVFSDIDGQLKIYVAGIKTINPVLDALVARETMAV